MNTVLTAVEIREDAHNHYPAAIYTLHLRRKPLFYVVNLIIPCFLLSLIAMVTFILLPNNADRLEIGIYVFLVINIRLVGYEISYTASHVTCRPYSCLFKLTRFLLI